jgi:hypothetical protein
MESEIKVKDTEEMARVCAELTKQNIIFVAKHYDDESWVIIIKGY